MRFPRDRGSGTSVDFSSASEPPVSRFSRNKKRGKKNNNRQQQQAYKPMTNNSTLAVGKDRMDVCMYVCMYV